MPLKSVSICTMFFLGTIHTSADKEKACGIRTATSSFNDKNSND